MASLRSVLNAFQLTRVQGSWTACVSNAQRSFSASVTLQGMDDYERAASDKELPVWKRAVPREWISSMTQYIDYDNIIPNYIKNKHLQRNLDFQRYNPEEKVVLGSQIALCVFVHMLGGRLKLYNEDDYRDRSNSLKIDKHGKTNHCKDVKVEAIDLSGTDIMYEGIEYLQLGEHLLHMDLSNCEYLTEWSIPRLNTIESLISLNVANNPYITERSLLALQHLPNLRRLDISGIDYFRTQPVALVFLEELLPNCVIVHNM